MNHTMGSTMRVGSINTGGSVLKALEIDWQLEKHADVLGHVDQSIAILEDLVHKAGSAGCDVAVLPESCMRLSRWERAHLDIVGDILPQAVDRMLERLGSAAAAHKMYLVCCNDTVDAMGLLRNTSFFLGRDGKEIGQYHKVALPLHEQHKTPGKAFPVYETPDLGGVGMLICYDMVFPETARCMALNGADIIFNPTVGGAAFGSADISRAVFRTRAVENFIYIIVAWGGGRTDRGSMILSPQGDILVEEKTPGAIAIADIDPFSGRQGGDFANWQHDLRARVFRERQSATYGVLTADYPPILDKLPSFTPGPVGQIIDIFSRGTTIGHIQHERAEEFLRIGELKQAIKAFETLRTDYPGSWFDRIACQRLAEIERRTR